MSAFFLELHACKKRLITNSSFAAFVLCRLNCRKRILITPQELE
ncbi:hypothetical protein CLONEX_01959 [[Clostridium] nexile DSM 1787]|nr:hypothetical protein CLONEX_01959 [[Clostridium] nexile DSM 1787]